MQPPALVVPVPRHSVLLAGNDCAFQTSELARSCLLTERREWAPPSSRGTYRFEISTTQDQKVKLGEAGEHLVISRLLAHGYVAGQLPRSYKADDVYVERRNEVLHVQVKTRLAARSWPTGISVIEHPLRYYALVLFESLEPPVVDAPTVYVLPSAKVKHAVELHDRLYRAAHPGLTAAGVPAVADRFRMREMSEYGYGPGWLDEYREAWGLLRG